MMYSREPHRPMTDPHQPHLPPTDDELARQALADRAAFSSLYERYLARVFRYCSFRVGSAAEAEDITAQVFLDALRALPRYRPQGNFAAWLFSIARRRCADHHRAAPPPFELLDSLPEPGDAIAAARRERLNALLARLPAADLELLRLRYAAGLDHAGIASLLHRTPAAVKMQHHRIVGKLRALWEEDDD